MSGGYPAAWELQGSTGADAVPPSTHLSQLSTRIKDAGIAIRHSRGGILFYTAGSRNGLEGVVGEGPGHKKEVVPKKDRVFCYGKIY